MCASGDHVLSGIEQCGLWRSIGVGGGCGCVGGMGIVCPWDCVSIHKRHTN